MKDKIKLKFYDFDNTICEPLPLTFSTSFYKGKKILPVKDYISFLREMEYHDIVSYNKKHAIVSCMDLSKGVEFYRGTKAKLKKMGIEFRSELLDAVEKTEQGKKLALLNNFKEDVETNKANTYIITARPDMKKNPGANSIKAIEKFLKKHRVSIPRTNIRCVNSAGLNKQKEIRTIIRHLGPRNISQFDFYDDDMKNIEYVKKLEKEFPNILVKCFIVDKNRIQLK